MSCYLMAARLLRVCTSLLGRQVQQHMCAERKEEATTTTPTTAIQSLSGLLVSFFLSLNTCNDAQFLCVLPVLSLIDPCCFSDASSAASLTVGPVVQRVGYDFVKLTCKGNSSSWRVRKFPENGRPYCSNFWLSGESVCTIDTTYSDDGVYWCESMLKEFSNAVNITLQGLQNVFFSLLCYNVS